MKIAKEQVLDLVNDLNNSFDGDFEISDDTCANKIEIIDKSTILGSHVADIDNLEMIIILTTRTVLRDYISIWANSLKDREQYVPTNKHFRLNNSENGIDTDDTYLKPLMDSIRDLSDAIIKLAKTKNEDPIVQAIKDSHNITVESRGIDSILLETAEKLNGLLDNAYGKRHPKEVTDSLLKIKRSLKD